MDTQQFQMFLNLLQNMGETGKEAFIWWLVFDKGLSFFGWIMALSISCWTLLKIIKHCNEET